MSGKVKTRRARRTGDEWAALLAEQVESGLSQGAFCESRRLSVSTFCNAKRRARAAASVADARPGGDFLPMVVESERAEEVAVRWDVELALGTGVVLRIRSG